MITNYSDKILAEGISYSIEISTGTSFQDVVYLGTKYLNGKNIMVFETKDHRQLTINPSFHTFTFEETQDLGNEEEIETKTEKE